MTVITLPSNFVASTTEVAQSTFNGLSSYTLLIAGVLLALVIIEVIIESLRGKR